jgi:hypothetical protein
MIQVQKKYIEADLGSGSHLANNKTMVTEKLLDQKK